ncbi:MAG: DUF927 domain-containing protein [Planctomycetia bacterium]
MVEDRRADGVPARGGGLDADGPVAIEMDAPPALASFQLPPPPDGAERRRVVQRTLELLDGLAPDVVVFPLLLAPFRAVVGDPGYSVFLVGPSGACKSELASLAQRFFGAEMDAKRLPGNWSSTDNAIEGLAFAAKDAVLVVDDFKPGGSSQDVQRLHQSADRVFRGLANGASRQRLTADCGRRSLRSVSFSPPAKTSRPATPSPPGS